MKKLTAFLVTVFIASAAISQEIDLGIKAGANFATITDASNASNKTGFLAGAFVGFKFSDKIGLQADLLYSQQGAEFDGEKFDLTYVNVPVVLKYYIIQGLNLQAGPQFGFVVDDNIKEVLGEINDAESSDVSGVVGVGYDFPFGIRLDARYNFGLTEVSKGSDSKNSVVSLAVGYSFL